MKVCVRVAGGGDGVVKKEISRNRRRLFKILEE